MLRFGNVVGLALAAIALGCSSSSSSDAPGQTLDTTLIDPAASCAPGTSPRVGQADCAPVGPSADVPDGFARDATGWGWKATLPDHACTGATIAILGQTDCQPLDDCDAPFPPANADVVVRPSEVPEASRGTMLADALAKAPRGGTVALDEGVYEGVTVHSDVHIVGRCAAKVIVRAKTPPPTGTEHPGTPEKGTSEKAFDFPYDVVFAMKGVTVEGFPLGLYADHATITLESVLFTGNRSAITILGPKTKFTATRVAVEASATYPRVDAFGVNFMFGPQATMTDIDVRGQDTGISVNSPDTNVTLVRTYVHDQHLPVYRGSAVEAFRQGTLAVDRSVLVTTDGTDLMVGRFISDPGTRDANAGAAKVTISKSLLVHEGGPSNEQSREGVMNMYDGATVSLEDVTVVHESFGAIAVTTGAQLATTRTAFLSGPSTAPTRMAVAVFDHGSSATLTDSAVVDPMQVGLFVHDRGASLTLTRSLVTGTTHRFTGDLGEIGGTGQAIAIGHGAVLEAADSALVANEGLGVFALDGVTAHLARTIVDDTRDVGGGLGDGVLVMAGSQLLVEDGVMRHDADAAIAADGSAGLVSRTLVSGGRAAVRTSGGTTASETKDEPSDVVDDTILLYSPRLLENEAKFLDGAVSLPSATP